MAVLWQKGSLLEYIFAPELSRDEDLPSNLEVSQFMPQCSTDH